jgi:phospholipase/lecithinase/hemolysin
LQTNQKLRSIIVSAKAETNLHLKMTLEPHMQQLKVFFCGLATFLLVACGGGGNGNQSPKIAFSSLVSFGDSLSDVGTYKVGAVASLGGGMYTVNSSTALNWTQILAAQLGLSAPCAAQTGLAGDPNYGFSVAVQNHTSCRNYAQGGSRVLHPYGPGNANLGGDNATLGELTVPIATQISNHLSVVNGSFSGTELVTVMAGANDLFMQATALSVLNTALTSNPASPSTFITYATQIAGWSSTDANAVLTAASSGGLPAAIAAAAPVMVGQMTSVGTSLANLIKTQIVAKGAKYTLVLNMPNVSKTPYANAHPELVSLLDALTISFNGALQTGLAGTAGVKYGDAYTTNTDQINHPAQYGLSNVTSTACLLDPAHNILGSSLICNSSNVVPGDVSTYLFADDVHPTPYGYKLLTQEAVKHLSLAGWM